MGFDYTYNKYVREKLDEISQRILSLSEISGYDKHVTVDETINANKEYDLKTLLGKDCEYIFVASVSKNVKFELDGDTVNYIKIPLLAEVKIGRKCEKVNINVEGQTGIEVLMYAFA